MSGFFGTRIYTDPNAVRRIRRPVREILFGRPWRPWRWTKTVPTMFVLRGGESIVCHPELYASVVGMFGGSKEMKI